jgi:hypothetical protein
MIENSISMKHSVLGCTLRHSLSLIAVALAIHSCGGDSPGAPTGLSAPTLASPQDDAVATGRPSLTVNNASGGSGARTYDFQVALSEAALAGPADGLFTSATGIAEAAGRTAFEVNRDLQAGRRYFWRARAMQAGTAGPWSGTFRFRSEAGTNAPPVIQAINVSSRAEAGSEIEVSATVQDQEAATATLVFEWSATGGTFAGTGASVRWTAPSLAVPTAYDLTLTVIERYSVALPGGADETRENRTTGRATVHANDSTREVSALSTTFIDDFLHSERTPEFCVRNFSDSCPGKQAELSDIRQNRARFVNNPSASSMGPASILFYDSGSANRRPVPASQALFAELSAPCRFAATDRTTGQPGVAVGTCLLNLIYESFQWRLCDSRFQSPSLSPSGVAARTSTISGAMNTISR